MNATKWALLLAPLAFACTGSSGGGGVLVETADAPSGACATSGSIVRSGVDADGDGMLSAAETQSETLLCDGEDGVDVLVELSAQPSSPMCPDGGTRLDRGFDDDGDGTLGAQEVTVTQVVCNSADGAPVVLEVSTSTDAECPPGARGRAWRWGYDLDGDGALTPDEVRATSAVCDAPRGAPSLLEFVPLAPGAACPGGGAEVRFGLDEDFDGALSSGELTGTTALCFGARYITSLERLSPGPTCPSGGWRVHGGDDDDGDGVLQPSEIQRTSDVCSGVDGTPLRMEVETVAAGAECAAGGLRFVGYLDLDLDGTRDANEPTQVALLCGGDDATAGLISDVQVVASSTTCPAGGVSVRAGPDDDGDGVLDPNEATSDLLICSGEDRAALVEIDELGSDPQCPAAARRIRSGWDLDANGALSEAETRNASTVCLPIATTPFEILPLQMEPALYLLPYRETLDIQGGIGDPTQFEWSVTDLPPGLAFDPVTRRIEGIARQFGDYAISILVRDELGQYLRAVRTLSVEGPLRIVEYVLPIAERGVPYDHALETVGGDGSNVTFTILEGTLPAGLSMSATGQITGTSLYGGGATFLLRVTAGGESAQAYIEMPQQTRWAFVSDSLPRYLVDVTGSTPGAPLPAGTSGANAAPTFGAFSPDGRWLIWSSPTRVVACGGATPQVVPHAFAGLVEGPVWSPDGRWFSYANATQRFVVDMSGTTVPAPTMIYPATAVPTFSPDGNRLAYRDGSQLFVVQLGSPPGPPQLVASGVSRFSWLRSTWIVMHRNSGLYVSDVAGTPTTPTLVGPSSATVVENRTGRRLVIGSNDLAYTDIDAFPGPIVSLNTNGTGSTASASPDGRLVFYEGGNAGFVDLDTEVEIRAPAFISAGMDFVGWGPRADRLVLEHGLLPNRGIAVVGLGVPAVEQSTPLAYRAYFFGRYFERALFVDSNDTFSTWALGPTGLVDTGALPPIVLPNGGWFWYDANVRVAVYEDALGRARFVDLDGPSPNALLLASPTAELVSLQGGTEDR